MDNLAHSLAGLAIAEAGLKRHTALGTTTLIIGANLPDVDAFTYLVGDGLDALVVRRGWTHGILAMAVLPLVLAGLMLAWDSLVRRRRTGDALAPVRGWWLVALAAAGIWSHTLLDLLNSYGVRLLMPFSGRWFYGDTLFIIDVWLWLMLGTGVLIARLRHHRGAHDSSTRPPRVAIALLLAYIGAMAAWSAAGRGQLHATFGSDARVMAAPFPIEPLSRSTIADLGDRYALGQLHGWSRRYQPIDSLPSGRASSAAAAAALTRDGAAFLSWSRFPHFTLARIGDSTRVRITDLRYGSPGDRSWASVEVTVPVRDWRDRRPAE